GRTSSSGDESPGWGSGPPVAGEGDNPGATGGGPTRASTRLKKRTAACFVLHGRRPPWSKRGPRGRVRASPRARTALDATKGERPRGQAASRTRLGSGIRDRLLLISVALGLAVASCYLPALDAEFITWDDPTYVTANPHLRSLSWSTTAWAFTTFYTG